MLHVSLFRKNCDLEWQLISEVFFPLDNRTGHESCAFHDINVYDGGNGEKSYSARTPPPTG